MFKKLKKGMTLVELIVVMIIIAAISLFIITEFFSTVDSAKETAFKETLINIERNIQINQSNLENLKSKINAISDGDEDILDELQQLGLVGYVNLESIFSEPSKAIFEIRTITENNSKYLIYFYLDSTNTQDKALIDKVIVKQNRKII